MGFEKTKFTPSLRYDIREDGRGHEGHITPVLFRTWHWQTLREDAPRDDTLCSLPSPAWSVLSPDGRIRVNIGYYGEDLRHSLGEK